MTAKRPRLCQSVDFGRPSYLITTFEFIVGYVMTIMTPHASVFYCSLDHECFDHECFDHESSTATHGVSRPGTARLSRRPGQGNFVL